MSKPQRFRIEWIRFETAFDSVLIGHRIVAENIEAAIESNNWEESFTGYKRKNESPESNVNQY